MEPAVTNTEPPAPWPFSGFAPESRCEQAFAAIVPSMTAVPVTASFTAPPPADVLLLPFSPPEPISSGA